MTGGSVYRGQAYSTLTGLYFYGDYCTGEIWALEETAPDSGEFINHFLLDTALDLSSFGEDEDGEIYLCDLVNGVGNAGRIYKIVGPLSVGYPGWSTD